jgi:hypothetical protein
MTRLELNGGIPSRIILETCRATKLPNGDIFYESDTYADGWNRAIPYQLIVSPQGQQLIESADSNILDLADAPLDRASSSRPLYESKSRDRNRVKSFATQEILRGGATPALVAVKRSFPEPISVTGLVQFQAMRALEDNEVSCAHPFLARRKRFVAAWNEGDIPSQQDKDFIEYLENLRKMVSRLHEENRWAKFWSLDLNSINYRVNDAGNSNLYKRFIALDPVFEFFQFTWKQRPYQPL